MTSFGAHWIRAALQVNPYGYQGASAPSQSYASEHAYNAALLDECEALGIGLIAVTDHWCVDSAQGLVAAAEARGIVALPGFEANTSEGVHLLVIFERDTECSTINGAIGACGAEPGCANGTTGNPYAEILEVMTGRGALVIPAHVNVPNRGLLTAAVGVPLVNMVVDPCLHAVAISPGKPDGTDQAAVVAGRSPYKRKHPLAVIHADDVMHPDGLKEAGASTWFKVSASCLESIKLAVRTPTTRVALADPMSHPRALLRSITWTGGFLDTQTIPLADDLTALIGGRGTGKSTVIESLRYALNIDPLGDDAVDDHQAVVSNVLRSGTIVTVEVESVVPTPRRYTIERTVPGATTVRDSSGVPTSLRPCDVLGPVEIFGQHELAELASDKRMVAEMIHRFASPSAEESGTDHDILLRLQHNRAEFDRVENAQRRLTEELADIPRLDQQVQRFTETDLPARLADRHRIDRDQAVFREALQRIDATAELVRAVAESQFDSILGATYDGVTDSPRAAIMERAAAATTALSAELHRLADNVSEAIGAARTTVEAAQQQWHLEVADLQEAHSVVLRTLHEEGNDPDTYLATTAALDGLRAKEPRREALKDELESLRRERDGFIDDLKEVERSQIESLHSAIRSANEATGGVVVVRPAPDPERSTVLEVIGRHISGQRTLIVAAVEAPTFSPRNLIAAIRAGEADLNRMGIRGAQATNLIRAGEPLLRELEELSLGQAVEVLLDVSAGSGARELKTIDELSKGQRATALLMLLLGASKAPLVIDQPEDDLDNRFVFDGVVPKLRELKGQRQVIASTHNANVPVLGDAELIVVLEGDGQHGWPAADGIGSLDSAPIRALAENILEGGPDAFNARQHLYGF